MRKDLANLNADALAQLANVGLVKRAQRELAAGYAPTVTLGADGTLGGTFPDGVRIEFPPGAGLRDSTCTCGAAGVCRHRIALVLAYHAPADSPEPGPASPGTLGEEELRAAIPGALLQAADRLERRHIVADVERATPGNPIPVVRLPMATVRFLAGADLGFARCDCRLVERCEHVALAVRAFRRADAEHAGVERARLELGDRLDAADREWPGLAAALASIFSHGVEAGPDRHAQALTQALDEARAHRATWIVLALEAVEDWLIGHVERSARFASAHGLRLMAELDARRRAAAANAALSAKEVLGLDEPIETELGRTRLVSLGCRIHEEADRLLARIALLDPDTGTKVLLRHAWSVGTAAPDPAKVRIGGALRLADLARGQVVGTTLRRRANGEVRIGATHGGRFSLTPQSGDWSFLPEGSRVRSLERLRAARRGQPPRLLQAPHGLADFEVVAVRTVASLAYDPIEQCVHAVCEADDGGRFLVLCQHSATTPRTLETLHHGLAGGFGAVTHVAGMLRFDAAVPVLDPWSLTTAERFVVPDCATDQLGLEAAVVAPVPESDDPIAMAFSQTEALLLELPHHGCHRVPRDWRERASAHAAQLRRFQSPQSAARVERLVESLREPLDAHAALTAFLVAAVWSDVMRERLGT